VLYTIAGRTHPKVLAREGEAYRRRLETMVHDLGIETNVEFVDSYLSDEQLDALLLDAGVVILPYDSTEQMVSGVLVEAVSAHVPVAATEFPHARELAEVGAVATAPHRDPEPMARAVSTLLGSPQARREMIRAQRAVAAELDWDVVARGYEALIERAVLETSVMSHVSTAS
jgi:glycosyltransferase involved in cell wall biosynthesis